MIGRYADGSLYNRCAEGNRLCDVWWAAMKEFDSMGAPTLVMTNAVNIAWDAYQAHVRACPECTQNLSDSLSNCTQEGE